MHVYGAYLFKKKKKKTWQPKTKFWHIPGRGSTPDVYWRLTSDSVMTLKQRKVESSLRHEQESKNRLCQQQKVWEFCKDIFFEDEKKLCFELLELAGCSTAVATLSGNGPRCAGLGCLHAEMHCKIYTHCISQIYCPNKFSFENVFKSVDWEDEVQQNC